MLFVRYGKVSRSYWTKEKNEYSIAHLLTDVNIIFSEIKDECT